MSPSNPTGFGFRGDGDGGLHRIEDAKPSLVKAEGKRLLLFATALDRSVDDLRNAAVGIALMRSCAIGTIHGQIAGAQGAAMRLSPLFAKAGRALVAFAKVLKSSKKTCNGTYDEWQRIDEKRDDAKDELDRTISVKIPLLPVEVTARDPRFWEKQEKEQELRRRIRDYENRLDELKKENHEAYREFKDAAKAAARAFGKMPKDLQDGRKGSIRGRGVKVLRGAVEWASTANYYVNNNKAIDFIEWGTGFLPGHLKYVAPITRLALNYQTGMIATTSTAGLVVLGEADPSDIWAAAKPAVVGHYSQVAGAAVGAVSPPSAEALKPVEIVTGVPLTPTGAAGQGTTAVLNRVLPPAKPAHTFGNPIAVRPVTSSPIGRPLTPVTIAPPRITVGGIPISIGPGCVVTRTGKVA